MSENSNHPTKDLKIMPKFIRTSKREIYAGKMRNFAIYECPYCENEYETMKFNVLGKNKGNCGCMTRKLRSHPTHGLSKTKLYKVWASMKDRCKNKNNSGYKNYGGRGISVCDAWGNHFVLFYDWAISNGYKEGLSIDRIDNDGNYHPDNCRFTTPTVQSMNKRYKISGNYLGVEKRHNNFISSVSIDNKKKHIGFFNTELEAALARDLYICHNNLGHMKNFNLKEI